MRVPPFVSPGFKSFAVTAAHEIFSMEEIPHPNSVYTDEEVIGMDDADAPGALQAQRLENWISQYSDAILRMCFVYLRDTGLAEDALQETFLKAWKHMDQFRGSEDAGAKAWLMRIAVNICHDYHRSRWFRHTDRSRTPEDLPPGMVAVLPEDQALLTDVYNLPEKEKQVILLYYYQELTLQETADALGLSRSAAHKRLAKARRLLRGRLTGRDSDGE